MTWWQPELRVLERRLHLILDQASTFRDNDEVLALLYREILIRAARLDDMLQAADDLSAPRSDPAEQRRHALVDRASSVARQVVSQDRQRIDRASDEFWHVRIPEHHPHEDRALATFRALLDTHANALLTTFALGRELPLPPTVRSTSTHEWLAALDKKERWQLRGWVQTFRLNRLGFGPSQNRDEGVMNMLTNALDENAVNRVRRLVDGVLGGPDTEIARSNFGAQIRELIEELARRAEEIGFDGLVESLLDGALQSDLRSLVNIVPGDGYTACSPVVVAVIRGKKRRCSWYKSFSALTAHFIRCARVTKLAIIVTDYWDDDSFGEDHAEHLRAFSSTGGKTIVLLGGQSSRGLTQLNIDV